MMESEYVAIPAWLGRKTEPYGQKDYCPGCGVVRPVNEHGFCDKCKGDN